MLRNIPIHHLKPPVDAVLIRRKHLQQNLRAVRLEEQAQQHAQRILRDARQQAELFHRHAYQDGYQQGLLCAVQHVASFLTASQSLFRSERERLAVHARALLSAAVDKPEVLLLLLEEGLRKFPESDETLYLILPDSARALEPKLNDLLASDWGGTSQLDYHAESRFIMRYADQVAEFSPEQYVEPATRLLQQQLDALPQACRQAPAEDALHKFIEQLQSQGSAAANDRSEP